MLSALARPDSMVCATHVAHKVGCQRELDYAIQPLDVSSIRNENAQRRAAVDRAPHTPLAQRAAEYSDSDSQVPQKKGAALNDDGTAMTASRGGIALGTTKDAVLGGLCSA